MSIVISPQNQIVVRCNMSISLGEIDKFVEAHAKWIERHLIKNQRVLDATTPIREYKSCYVLGKIMPLVISNRNYYDGETLYVKDKKYIYKTLFDLYGEERIERLRVIAHKMGLEPSLIRYKKFTARWACCDTKNVITLSYATLMLSDYHFDYIAVHELCHMFYMNHSAKFKQTLTRFQPDWRKRWKEMKEYSYLLKIY